MNEPKSIGQPGEIISLQRWCAAIGISDVTAWRFRKRGWLKTINIAGRVYLTHDDAREFTRRAQAGEFARNHPVPAPPFKR